jgi:hypothetical protein
MVLAAYGMHVQESELAAQVEMDVKGTPIAELERLARRCGLEARIQDTTVAGLREILAEGSLPISFIDRAVFDLTPRQRARHSIRSAIIHNVIPVGVTAKSVTLHDPRQPNITRKSIRLFRLTYEHLGGRSVVCSERGGFEPRSLTVAAR